MGKVEHWESGVEFVWRSAYAAHGFCISMLSDGIGIGVGTSEYNDYPMMGSDEWSEFAGLVGKLIAEAKSKVEVSDG